MSILAAAFPAPRDAPDVAVRPNAAPPLWKTDGGPLPDAVVRAAVAGDPAAFDALYARYSVEIREHVYRMIRDRDDAENLTQDTFLKAWLKLPEFRGEFKLRPWLHRIATNVCLDELRHRKLVKWQPWDAFISVFHPSQVAGDQPDRDVLNAETEREIREVLDAMMPIYRRCLLLREYHELSYDEMADLLCTTRAAVKSLLYRSRRTFGDLWKRRERAFARNYPNAVFP